MIYTCLIFWVNIVKRFFWFISGYLETSNHNVWLVDWAEVAKGPCYPIVVHNLNYVGTCIAQLIREITNASSVSPESAFHVVGFSIGAHAAAYTANNLRPYKLPRITGKRFDVRYYVFRKYLSSGEFVA